MRKAQTSAKTTAANINKAFADHINVGRVIERSVTGFITALTLGSLIAAGKAALEYAGHLGELADTLGLTTKDLQTFSYAAGQVGISQDELQVGIQKLTISMGQAELGSKKQTTAFRALGISIDQLKDKDTGDVFRLIAERLEKVSDRSQRAAIEVALFGKAGAKLDNLLSGAQGRLSELSDAAERLGIVLSDEQIRKADETADKIEALKTVLKARIAGEVADNADAILTLANALNTLIGSIGDAIRGWKVIVAEFKAGLPFFALGPAGFGLAGPAVDRAGALARAGVDDAASSVTVRLPPARKAGARTGTNIPQFLGGGGGGGGHKARADHSAEDLLRKQHDSLMDQLRADQDILEAKKDLSGDYVEQTSLQIDILNKQREIYAADLAFEVATKKKTQAEADILLAKYDEADHYKRQKVLDDEQEQRQQDVADLIQDDFDRRRELLEKQEDLATTQSERRKIELDLLRLAYEEKRQALQRIIDESKNAKDIENARRDLVNLNANYALDRQDVMQRTRGPLEEWAATVPQTAAQINEALQSIEAQGLDGLTDAITDVITGTRSLKEAFGDLAKSIISDIIRMTVRMLIFRAVTAIFGGGTQTINVPQWSASNLGGYVAGKLASGGPVMSGRTYLVGERGPELFMPRVGGSIIPNGVAFGNDNFAGRNGDVTIHQTIQFEGVAVTEEKFVRGLMAVKAATLDAIREDRRRGRRG